MNSPKVPFPHSGRSYVVAMVLGTALTALGPTAAPAAVPEATSRAVNDLSRYCTACWRNAHLHPDCWTDCTQEVLTRLLERVHLDAWGRVLKAEGEEHREFLRAIDTVKKRSQRGRKWSAVGVDEVADREEPRERRLVEDREAIRRAGEELLSPSQEKILELSLDGWQVHDIATELGLPPERISDQKYKAIRKLREFFCHSERRPETFLELA